jgi:hypothetical protein
VDQGTDQGMDQGNEQGNDQGNDPGMDQGNDQGMDQGNDQGMDLARVDKGEPDLSLHVNFECGSVNCSSIPRFLILVPMSPARPHVHTSTRA